MRKSESIKAGGIILPLVVFVGACGGGGGEPGGSPHADNTDAVKLHPAAYFERWWPGCTDDEACAQPAAEQAH